MLPWCAQCGRPVRQMSRRELLDIDATVFTVYCHGEIEETTIPAMTFINMSSPNAIEPGIAFKQKHLPSA